MARDKSKVCQKYVRKSMQKRGESGGGIIGGIMVPNWTHCGVDCDKYSAKDVIDLAARG